MNRAQLLGLVFLVMGIGHAGVAVQLLLRAGPSTVELLYLLASVLVVVLSVVSIYRPGWVDNEDLAAQVVTRDDAQLVAVAVFAMLVSVAVGYSFIGWFS